MALHSLRQRIEILRLDRDVERVAPERLAVARPDAAKRDPPQGPRRFQACEENFVCRHGPLHFGQRKGRPLQLEGSDRGYSLEGGQAVEACGQHSRGREAEPVIIPGHLGRENEDADRFHGGGFRGRGSPAQEQKAHGSDRHQQRRDHDKSQIAGPLEHRHPHRRAGSPRVWGYGLADGGPWDVHLRRQIADARHQGWSVGRHHRACDRFELPDDLGCASWPGRGLLGEQTRDQIAETGGQAGADPIHPWRMLGEHLPQGLRRALPAEGRASGKHLVEQDSQREEVRALVRSLAARLLGGHRVEGAEQGTVLRDHGIVGRPDTHLGEAEVEDLGASPGGDHHVLGLEGAVDEPRGMGGGEPLGDLARQPHRGLRFQAPGLGQGGGQRPALDVLQDDAVARGVLKQVVDLHDGRMAEAGDGPGLAQQPLAHGGIEPVVVADPLDRHPPPQPGVPGQEDLPHPPAAEEALDLIGADSLPTAGGGSGSRQEDASLPEAERKSFLLYSEAEPEAHVLLQGR